MTAYGIPTGGGHASLTMGYDDDGMRAWKENSSSTRTYFLYDGSDIIAELTSTGALGTYQTVGIDGVVSRRAGITTTYFAFDPSGNVSAVLSSSGGVRGDELFEANGHADSSYRNRPVDFGGQWGYYGDSETGLTLLGHRYYDSYAGRFLTRDPIGYSGGLNLYSYTANNYANRTDASGFDYDSSAWYAKLASGAAEWASYLKDQNNDYYANSGAGIAVATFLNSAVDLAAGMAEAPNAVANLGTGTGIFAANPTFENTQCLLDDAAVFSAVMLPVLAPEALGRGGCFVAGTPVEMADGTTKPIEDVRTNDLVKSRDPVTGQDEDEPVLSTSLHPAQGLVTVSMREGRTGQTQTVTCVRRSIRSSWRARALLRRVNASNS